MTMVPDNRERDVDRIIDETERLGVVGSPSSTSQLAMDVLGAAVSRKLVGELALFRFHQDGIPHYALGQITEVQLRNIWHEDPTMRSLIRQRGRVDAVSERQDTHLAQMVVSAVFRAGGPGGYEPSILGTVPSTGTTIHVVTDEVLQEILRPNQQQIFYLGRLYGSKPKLPLWFKHFSTGPDGAGEAYHLGIFGKTGSGKSVLAKMMLVAYSRHPDMAILVIDPQGEFSRDLRSGPGPGEFPLPLGDLIAAHGKPIDLLTVRSLVLDRWELFEQILYESPFFERLTMPKGENRQTACSVLADRLQKAPGIKLASLWRRESFDKTWKLLAEDSVQKVFYRSEGSRDRFKGALREADREEFYKDYWQPVTELFRTDRAGATTVDAALKRLLSPAEAQRPVLAIDLSHEQAHGLFWNDMIQALVIKRLLDGLTLQAERSYREGESLNTLVVIDEAHRLAPRHMERDSDGPGRDVRVALIDAARTTRKYGLGWLFISQTLSSLHAEILQQLRIFFFGFGLGLGQEFTSLKELVGGSGSALALYQLFRDPHSAFDTASRQYSFMTIGPVSPLSFSGSPLFFNAFNTVDEFLSANRLTRHDGHGH